MGFLFLVGHSRAASFLRLLPPPHTQLTHTHNLSTHNLLLTHTTCSHTTSSHTTRNLATSTITLPGRRGTWRHRRAFCVAGVALMALGWLWWRACAPFGAVSPQLFVWQAWHLATSTWRHRPSHTTLSHTTLSHTTLLHTQTYTH